MAATMSPQTAIAFACSFLLVLVMIGGKGAGAASVEAPEGHAGPALTSSTGSPEKKSPGFDVDGPPSSSLEEHQMRKRFIWTLTQEPYFYGKYEGSAGSGVSHGSELLPEPMPLRKPTSMHKRLYPRWYHAYPYKPSSFSPMAASAGERKRFQPFHPMARFRGLSMGGGSTGGRGYHSTFDLPLTDQPGHPVPSAPNAPPSPNFNSAVNVMDDEDDEEVAEEVEDQIRAGELLQYLRSIASDRGLSGNTKSFRFGISRRK